MRGNALSLPSGQAVAKTLEAKYPHVDARHYPVNPGKAALADCPLVLRGAECAVTIR